MVSSVGKARITAAGASETRADSDDCSRSVPSETMPPVEISSPLLALEAALILAASRSNNPAVLHYLELARLQTEEIAGLLKLARRVEP